MGVHRRILTIAITTIWLVGAMAVPGSFAASGPECGPYTGSDCEGPGDEDPASEEPEVLDEAEDDGIVVQPVAEQAGGGSALARTGIDTWMLTLSGVMLLGVGSIMIAARRRSNSRI